MILQSIPKHQWRINWIFSNWAVYCGYNNLPVYLRLRMHIEVHCSFPMSGYTLYLNSRFKSYGIFKILAEVQACYQPLLI
jgi:hypothetical protein